MKIRTAEMLSDKLSQDLSWRKKELTDLKYIIQLGSVSKVRKNVLGRCGIAILYAHWEGFIKISSIRFLEFISSQRLTNAELSDNLLSLIIKHKTSQLIRTKKASSLHFVTEFFMYELNDRSLLPYKNVIDTESNLSSKVFREVVWCLGLDYSPYATSEKIIDEKLLGRRNHVAHGEYLPIDLQDYSDLHDRVISLMNTFRNQVENSAVTKSFIRS